MSTNNRLNKISNLTIFFIILFIAFISRFYGIWLWDLVGDENFTATLAHERYKTFLNPAYYALVVVFYDLFGQEYWVSRIPALILSVISIPILFYTWSKTVGRNAALFAAIILIFSAWHLWYSQFARHYAGVFLFSSCAYYFFFRALYSDRVSHLIWALIFSLVSILFHMTAVWVPASSAAAYFIILIIHRKNDNYSLRIIKIYMAICIVAIIATIPFLFKIMDEWVKSGESWGYGPILILPQLIKYIQFPIVISSFFGWLLLIKKEPITATFFAVTIVLPALFLVVATPFMAISPAYAFYILPLVIVLSGIACEETRKHLASSSFLFSFLTIALLIVSLIRPFASHYLDKTSININDIHDFLGKNYRKDDSILNFVTGFNHNKDRQYKILPFISNEGDLSTNWNEELQSLLVSNKKTWIILSSKRHPIAPNLESWLLCNARLVWRKHAIRIDSEVNGYQVFLFSGFNENEFNGGGCS